MLLVMVLDKAVGLLSSLTLTVSTRLPLTSAAPVYLIFPAVEKKVFNASLVPSNVTDMPLFEIVTPGLSVGVITPSVVLNSTLRLVLSTSAKASLANSRLPSTSSVTVKLTGALTVGASGVTLFTFKVMFVDADQLPASSPA